MSREALKIAVLYDLWEEEPEPPPPPPEKPKNGAKRRKPKARRRKPKHDREEIFQALETFYRRFYFRPRKLFTLGAEMLRDRAVMKRRLGEGLDFVRFLARRRHEGESSSPTVAKS